MGTRPTRCQAVSRLTLLVRCAKEAATAFATTCQSAPPTPLTWPLAVPDLGAWATLLLKQDWAASSGAQDINNQKVLNESGLLGGKWRHLQDPAVSARAAKSRAICPQNKLLEPCGLVCTAASPKRRWRAGCTIWQPALKQILSLRQQQRRNSGLPCLQRHHHVHEGGLVARHAVMAGHTHAEGTRAHLAQQLHDYAAAEPRPAVKGEPERCQQAADGHVMSTAYDTAQGRLLPLCRHKLSMHVCQDEPRAEASEFQ
mmetsp:Transcript_70987/g.201150  ORF Transcript_70987/g.201150 Transcript_70987/m.201150 type:complete len:257 (-) Transcript_70987:190-960(-)